MKIKFLGVGGAFSNYKDLNTCLYVEDFKLLIDCGEMMFPAIKPYLPNIDTIMLTHMHFDHIGALSTIGYYNYFVLNRKINVVIPVGTKQDLLSTFNPSMCAIQDLVGNSVPMDLEKYFWIFERDTDKGLIDNVNYTYNKHVNGMLSMGISFEKQEVLYTSDNVDASMYHYRNKYKHIITDCAFNKKAPSNVHITFDELVEAGLQESFKGKKMYIVHYDTEAFSKRDFNKPAFMQFMNTNDELEI